MPNLNTTLASTQYSHLTVDIHTRPSCRLLFITVKFAGKKNAHTHKWGRGGVACVTPECLLITGAISFPNSIFYIFGSQEASVLFAYKLFTHLLVRDPMHILLNYAVALHSPRKPRFGRFVRKRVNRTR